MKKSGIAMLFLEAAMMAAHQVFPELPAIVFWLGVVGFIGTVVWMTADHFEFPNNKISLKKAAQKTYDELVGTPFHDYVKSFHPDDLIGYYLHALTEKSPMYGIEPPGTKMRLIKGAEGLGSFKDGGDKWGGVGSHDVTHTNIHIEKKAMNDYIKLKKAIKREGIYR